MHVMVTGGSGIVGHYVIDELVHAGHTVVNADRVRPGDLSHSGTGGSRQKAAQMREAWPSRPTFFEVDVRDYGQVISAMYGCDAVVHLAACPSNAFYTEETVFTTNVDSMWNVMHAAEQLGIQNVILGSSYNAVGAMGTSVRWGGAVKPVAYFPIDANSPTRSEEAYSVSKWVGEHVADAFARRNPQMRLSSMRFNGMWDDDRMRELHANPITDPMTRANGFWTYLHIRDAGIACRMAVESSGWTGHERMFLNADDTMIDIPTMDAIKEVYASAEVRETLEGFQAPVKTDRAREVLGWRPKYSWRDAQFAS